MYPQACRITVVGPERRLDLVVPATVPVSELVPELVRLAGGDEGGVPGEWNLSRLTGPDLEPEETLAASDVGDGSILMLRHDTASRLGVLGSEPVDEMAEAVDSAGRPWGPRHTGRLAAFVAGALLLIFGLAMATLNGPARSVAYAPLILGAAGIGGSIALAMVEETAVQILAFPAALLLGLGATRLVGAAPSVAWHFVVFGAVVSIASGGVFVAGRTRHALLALAGVSLVLVLAGVASLVFDALDVAAVTLVLAVAALGGLPRASIVLAGLPSDPRSVISGGLPVASRRAHDQLAWLFAATAFVATIASITLATHVSVYGRLLALFAGLAFLLRSRDFVVAGEVAALAGGGLACISALCVALFVVALSDGSTALAVAWIGVPAAAVVGVALGAGRRRVSPVLQVNLKRAEIVTAAALLPLAAGQLGLYTAIHDFASTLL